MKSEERHRLQESELEHWGRQAKESWESFSKNYGKAVLIGIGVVCLLAAIVIWWVMSSNAAQAERWKDVITASFDPNPSQSLLLLERASTQHADHPAGQWAALMEAERALSEGIRASRSDWKACADELTRARDAFGKLLKSDSELIQERRAFGMARCLEALAGVDLEKAEKGENVPIEEAQLAYEKFLEDYDKEDSQSIFVPLARERSQALKNESTQEYYAWLQTQYPTPEDRATPDDSGTDPALPPGHPPVSPSTPPMTPGTPPIGPSFPEGPDFPTADESQDAMMNELERIVNEAKPNAAGGSDGGSGPAGAEKRTGNEAEASNPPASSNEDNGAPDEPKPGGSDPASADKND